MFHDIRVVMTHEEALALYNRSPLWDKGPVATAKDAYDQMGNGRTSWGVPWDYLSPRLSELVHKLYNQYKGNKYGPRGELIFSSMKEVYPPVFHIILY